jgi:hypothetical protein
MNKNPVLTVLLAWLLPGAGHWYLGQRVRGAIFCLLLAAVFTLGVVMTGGGCLSVQRHPYALALQACDGAVAGLAFVFVGESPEPAASKLNDFGMLLTLVAGALNVLLIADALYRTSPDEARDEEID